MNPGVLVDITQIPTQMGGLASVTTAIAVSLLAVMLPYTAVEMNVAAMRSRGAPDYGSFVVRLALVLACLLSYTWIYSLFLNIAQALSFAVLSEQDWGNFLVQNLSAPNAQSPILSWLTHPLSSIQAIVLFLSSLLAIVAKEAVVMIQACLLSVLFAFGPIAVVCGLGDKTRGVLRGWIVNTIQVGLWSFFLRLAVRVWLTLAPQTLNAGGVADDFLGIFTVNVCFLLMVLGTPILASRLISGEGLAIFGEAALAAVEAVMVKGALKPVGRSVAGVGKIGKKSGDASGGAPKSAAPPHTISSTATAAYRRIFGGGKPPRPKNQEPPGPAAQGKEVPHA
ncbi:MAG: hypothetical protein KGL04_04480 [Elusimicrobia bacterium]|nr:hypothetical protein [Elusimicrobiota bacterium]MDE2313414.1 hypothetical protein [Elusimicrobiota bacterium]